MSEENILIQVAMQIILNAGNARLKASDALSFAKKGEFAKAEELMAQAEEDIVTAHKAQTEVIQNEMSGQGYDYSLLFTHAQDTLMTIKSELTFSKELIDVLKIVFRKDETNE
ncbi:MAG: PTS lactose/cellobiose transporter subunit IIA [Erysipelotrichaceae bacterium]|nr:PTS lactose/cellobiose transporter subunit IIA [Erysipelotrichaceae bacterium]